MKLVRQFFFIVIFALGVGTVFSTLPSDFSQLPAVQTAYNLSWLLILFIFVIWIRTLKVTVYKAIEDKVANPKKTTAIEPMVHEDDQTCEGEGEQVGAVEKSSEPITVSAVWAGAEAIPNYKDIEWGRSRRTGPRPDTGTRGEMGLTLGTLWLHLQSMTKPTNLGFFFAAAALLLAFLYKGIGYGQSGPVYQHGFSWFATGFMGLTFVFATASLLCFFRASVKHGEKARKIHWQDKQLENRDFQIESDDDISDKPAALN